jgi:hypothetical protein
MVGRKPWRGPFDFTTESEETDLWWDNGYANDGSIDYEVPSADFHD